MRKVKEHQPNMHMQVNMQPKQANHQLKLNLQTIMQVKVNSKHKQVNSKHKQVNHPCATIGQLQIVGLTGRHLGAKLKSKHKQVNSKPKMKPKLLKMKPKLLKIDQIR